MEVLPVLKVVEKFRLTRMKADEEEEPVARKSQQSRRLKRFWGCGRGWNQRRDFPSVERLLAEADGSSGTIFGGWRYKR